MVLVSALTAAIAAKSLALASQFATSHSEGSMNSLVVLTRRGSYDEVSREYDSEAEEVLYDNFAEPGTGARGGVGTASGSSQLSLGDETQYYSSVSIYLPQDGPTKNPRVDDVVKVVQSPEKDIEGRYFRVVDVPAGGRLYSSITLQCVGIAPSRQWQP